MGKRGPRKEPEKMKLLKGTYRQDRDDGPRPKPLAEQLPEWLPGEAKDKWHELAPKLVRHGLLTEIDVDEFAKYCLFTIRAIEAEGEVAAHGLLIKSARGDGQMVKNPAVQIARDYAAAASKLADKFGLNPATRTGLSVEPVDDDDDDSIRKMIDRKREECEMNRLLKEDR